MSDETLQEELDEEIIEDSKEKKKKKEKKKDIIAELEDKCAELNEKYLYALAQMRDLHKTYEKENAISVKYVTYDLMEELLPIVDIFGMVLENTNVPDEVKAYFKGFELVFNQFKQILDNHGVVEIVTKEGDKFDHNVHNGVEKIEIEEGEHDTIAQVLQKGYRIGDKVLRPVSVKVYSLKQENIVEQETAEVSEDKGE
jgi:molecular chaperone GrpE